MAIKYGIKVFQCDVCGHRWLPDTDQVIPAQCPSRQCRSRRWNDSNASAITSVPVVAPTVAALPAIPAASALAPPAMTPRCPLHRLPLVRNDETGIWSCRVTKCRQRADDESVKLAYETADFATI
jgi:ribosomal protein L37AE/L43A